MNDPVSLIDPDGEMPVIVGVIIGKAIAVGVGYIGAKIAASFVSEEASDGVDMATGKIVIINATEIAGMAAGEVAGAALGFGIRASTCPTKISGKADDILKFFDDFFKGEKPTVKTNKSGDKILMTNDKKIRFDFNNSHGDKPHVHFEKLENGKWQDAFDQHRFYPME